VRFSPPSITKNDKFDREKNCKYLAKRSFKFNQTKKFGINTTNYTRNLKSTIQTGQILELDKK
jgi:hypothetical protein